MTFKFCFVFPLHLNCSVLWIIALTKGQEKKHYFCARRKTDLGQVKCLVELNHHFVDRQTDGRTDCPNYYLWIAIFAQMGVFEDNSTWHRFFHMPTASPLTHLLISAPSAAGLISLSHFHLYRITSCSGISTGSVWIRFFINWMSYRFTWTVVVLMMVMIA